jgi:integrase/recombinase XerC
MSHRAPLHPSDRRFEAWLLRDHQPATARAYARWVHIFQTWLRDRYPHGNEQHIETVTGDDVAQFVARLRQRYRPATVSAALVALAAWGRWACAEGYRGDNPCILPAALRTPAAARSPHMLTDHETTAVLHNGAARMHATPSRQARQRTLAVLILHTGLRVSEVCALRWEDIRLEETEESLIVRPRQGATSRTIPLAGAALEALGQWIRQSAPRDDGLASGSWDAASKRRLAAWISQHGAAPVFPNPSGTVLTPRMVQRDIADLAAAASVADVTPQTLRHTFARTLLDRGVSLAAVAALLGHRTLSTTAVYVDRGVSDTEIRRMVAPPTIG